MNTPRQIWILFLLPLLASLTAAQSYTLTDLGVLPGNGGSVPFAINGRGHVVGCSCISTNCDSASCNSAFLWTEKGGIQALQPPTGGGGSAALAINDSGDAVGYVSISANGYAAFWDKNGRLQIVGDIISSASGINDRGEITGSQGVPFNTDYAFIRSEATGTRKLYVPQGASWPFPAGINRLGHICGRVENSATYLYHSILWTESNVFDLGTLPGGTFCYATAINNLDEVVGYGDNNISYYQGYLWSKATGIRAIGAVNKSDTIPLAINDLGQVVGYATPQFIGNRAFLWSNEQGLQDLNNLIDSSSGWVLTSASGINASGQIVGTGTLNYVVHAFLLTPKN